MTTPPPSPLWELFDLRRHVLLVVQRWRVVALVTIAVTLIVVVANQVIARVNPQYRAEATLLLIGTKFQITLDPRIVSQDALPNLQAAQAGARAEEYRVIATSADVRAMAQALRGDLDESAVARARIAVRVRGALVTLSVSDTNAQRAVQLTNLFATAVATRLDTVYGPSAEDRIALISNLTQISQQHSAAEQRLSAYLQTSQLQGLRADLEQAQVLLARLAQEQSTLVGTQLGSLYLQAAELDSIRRDAVALRQQVVATPPSPTANTANALAYIVLRNRLANLPMGVIGPDATGRLSQPVQRLTAIGGATTIQITAPSFTDQGPSVLELDSLIAGVDQRQSETTAALEALAEQLRQPGRAPITRDAWQSTGRRVAELESAIRSEEFQRAALEREAEAARLARAAVETKLQELVITTSTTGGKAITVAPALNAEPDTPLPLGRLIPVAALLGLVIGVGVALSGSGRSRAA